MFAATVNLFLINLILLPLLFWLIRHGGNIERPTQE
jgi:hypothetical protein